MKTNTRQKERLLRVVDEFSRLSIVALGDLVADEFVYGEISRVSREAPVLILKHRERRILPGGGANAIYNLADLGVDVLPVGVVGDDDAGRQLMKAFRKKRIATAGIVVVSGHSTVTKTRILAGHTHTARQQVVRIDREPNAPLPERVTRRLQTSARQYGRAADALLVSDYGYGAATPHILNAVRATRGGLAGVPITIDSRYRLLEYTGATAATPNEPEVEEALGVRIGTNNERLMSAGRVLMQRMKLQSLLITRGRDGMVSFERGQKAVTIGIHGSDQVADVTGAGDTVIAAYTAALAAGAESADAARIANYAGGIVVMKLGTATVTADELRAAIEQDSSRA